MPHGQPHSPANLPAVILQLARLTGARLTLAQMSERLGISSKTLTTRVRGGALPRPGSDGKWLVAELLEWSAWAPDNQARRSLGDLAFAVEVICDQQGEWMTRAQLCERLGVGSRTVTSRVRAKSIPAPAADGRWLREEVVQWESPGFVRGHPQKASRVVASAQPVPVVTKSDGGPSFEERVLTHLERIEDLSMQAIRGQGGRLTRAEMCERLGIAGKTLTARIRRGDVPPPLPEGRWLLARVMEWERGQ